MNEEKTSFWTWLRKIRDTWIAPKESAAPTWEKPAVISIETPGGKIKFSAVISSGGDAREVKKVSDILLSKCEEQFNFEDFIGRTE